MDIIFTIGIFLSFFQFILLLNKKSKTLPDKVLACWMCIIGVHLTSYYLYYLGYWNRYPHMVGITAPFPLLHGPMLYLYTLTSLKNSSHLRRIDYLHFMPTLLSYLYMFKFYFFYTAEQKRLVDNGSVDDFSVFSIILLIAFMVSGISYSLFSYRLANRHKFLVDNNFSYDERINLTWLQNCIWGTGIIFLTIVAIIVSRDFLGIEYHFNADLIFYSMLVLAILALGYFGIRHRGIFIDNVVIEEPTISKSRSRGEYKNSGLKEVMAQDAHQKLLEIMSEQKPYLEPKLTLNNLAKMMDISPNHLSQIINQQQNQNFHDFINKYRIEEFINNAAKNSNYSILANALSSGFNSKSSFNGVFKKFKGMPPSQYMSEFKN